MSMRVAVVGAGWMGETHARAIAAADDTVALVIDADLERARDLAGAFGAAASVELAEAASCDAAVIATPSNLHLSQSESLAALGLSLLVEEPHRFPAERADTLATALARSGKHYQVGMTTRFNPGIRAIATAVAAGRLGQILSYVDRYWFQLAPDTLSPWYFDPKVAGGGVLLTNGVHIIDRCRWILGEDVDVVAHDLETVIPGHGVEDMAVVTLSGRRTGVPISVSLLWSDMPVGASELVIVGSEGIARFGPESWSIDTRSGSEGGASPGPDIPFALQWRDFAANCTRGVAPNWKGPGFAALEATLDIIASIYSAEVAA